MIRVLVVTNARVYYHYTRGYGCQGTRRSPRPLKGERFFNASGAPRRGRFSHVWEKSRDDRVLLPSPGGVGVSHMKVALAWRPPTNDPHRSSQQAFALRFRSVPDPILLRGASDTYQCGPSRGWDSGISYAIPLPGGGGSAWSEAKCVTGWGDSLSSSVVFQWFDLSFARRWIDP